MFAAVAVSDASNPNCQTATSLFLGRMSGRRTGIHFAWPCSAVLAAEIRASARFSFRFAPAQKRGARLCSQERERSAARRNGIEAAPAKEPHRLARPVRLTALHCGVIRWWDPSAPPACRSSLGFGHLTRRRDGRFHPNPLQWGRRPSPHISRGQACESPGAGRRPHSRSVSLCRAPLSEWG